MPGYDPTLQADLDALWFRMPANVPQDRMAEYQQFLLREFQICSREDKGAKLKAPSATIDADQLVQIALSGAAKLPATHWPDGNADAATLAAIKAWLAQDLRCPIIFQELTKGTKTTPSQIVAQGFFFPGEVTDAAHHVWVKDFTGRYPIVTDSKGNAQPAAVIVGAAVKRVYKTTVTPPPPAKPKEKITVRWGNFAGPAQRVERLGPDQLTGKAWSALSAAQQSTFRVIAAIAFVETGDALDSINAWDTSALSVGPYQYTAFGPNETGKAELAAFLAYLRARSATAHDRLFRDFGLSPKETWSAALRVSNGTFAAQLEFVTDQSGTFAPPATVGARDWLRCWPTIHRARYAIAQSPDLRTAMWNFARQRLYDLLGRKWPGMNAAIAAKTMGDVFRTEAAAAMLLRIHVNRPAYAIKPAAMDALIADSGIATPVSKWGAPEDNALLDAMCRPLTKPDGTPNTGIAFQAYLPAGLRKDLASINTWSRPAWGGALSRKQGFAPDYADIPFPLTKET
jgi:hypothetical protein